MHAIVLMHTTQDNLFSLKAPRELSTLSNELWTKVTAALATCYEVKVGTVCQLLPHDIPILQFGRVSRSGGGDSMQGRDLAKLGNGERDASFIRVLSVAFISYVVP